MTSTLTRVLALAALLALGAGAQTTRHVPGEYPSLGAAITAAQPGDTVLVAPGAYAETIDFAGKAIRVRSSGGPLVTTLASPGVAPVAGPVVAFRSGEPRTTVFEGFTVVSTGFFEATGIEIEDASPTIRNCIVTANASDGAFGIVSRGGGPALTNCHVNDCFALPFGYGIVVEDGAPALISDCVVRNCGGDAGAAIAIDHNDAMISGCLVELVATNAGGEGAITIVGSLARVESTEIRGCTGFGVVFRNGASWLVNSIVHGCAGGLGIGAGVLLDGGTPRIVNSTIALNTNGYPGQPSGGGVIIRNAAAQIANTILSGNTPDQITVQGAATPDVQSSLVQGGFPGVFVIDADPRFEAPSQGDFRLRSSSPCVDAGSTTFAGLVTLDAFGDPRQVYHGIDIGADEWFPPRAVALSLIQAPTTMVIRNDSALPGHRYLTTFSLDPANFGPLQGFGAWGGLFVSEDVLVQQAALGTAPFVGILDLLGRSTYVIPISGVPPGLALAAITHAFDPITGECTGVSSVATWLGS